MTDTTATPRARTMRTWQRFSPRERIARSSFYLLAIVAVVWSLRSIEIIPEFLYDAPQQTADLFARMWPIDWAWYPTVVQPALIETLHTATLGTILAIAIAALVALMVARNITHSVLLNGIGRFILVATRSVHAMIWALFFVAVFGPGALAGTLAIAVHSIGFTGKFLSEAIEEAKPGPIEALTAAGAPPLAILLKGYWPQVKPAFLAIAMFRWDINVRESAVLGLVGGGGLGMALDTALSNLYWDQAGLVLFVIFVVVIADRDRHRVGAQPDHLIKDQRYSRECPGRSAVAQRCWLLRCRPGTATDTAFAAVPALRCITSCCTASGTRMQHRYKGLYLSWSATLATPAMAHFSSPSELDPLTPTAPIVSLPILIGTPPRSAMTSSSCRWAAMSGNSVVRFAQSADVRPKVRAV